MSLVPVVSLPKSIPRLPLQAFQIQLTETPTWHRIVYAVSGRGAISSLDEQGNEHKRVLDPGDWALIPANREHKEVNDGDEEVVWVIVRAPGGVPEVVNLTGWKGEEVK